MQNDAIDDKFMQLWDDSYNLCLQKLLAASCVLLFLAVEQINANSVKASDQLDLLRQII